MSIPNDYKYYNLFNQFFILRLFQFLLINVTWISQALLNSEYKYNLSNISFLNIITLKPQLP